MNVRMQKNLRHIVVLLMNLFIFGTNFSFAQLTDVNKDTPNIGFEKGTFEGWTRYFGFYGPNVWSTEGNVQRYMIVELNKIMEEFTDPAVYNKDHWTVRNSQMDGTNMGDFQIMSSSSIDNNIYCDALKQLPEGNSYAVRIGSILRNCS